MTFGNAIEHMRNGLRVHRAGWNGKGMYLFIITEWSCIVYKPNERAAPCAPFIAIKTADSMTVPWLASQADMLAMDWDTVEVAE